MAVAKLLSKRELEVACHLLDGKTYREIASGLFVSPHTVRDHIKAIYAKLEVHSRAELVKKMLAR